MFSDKKNIHNKIGINRQMREKIVSYTDFVISHSSNNEDEIPPEKKLAVGELITHAEASLKKIYIIKISRYRNGKRGSNCENV